MIYALYAIGSVAGLIALLVIVAALRPSEFRVVRSQLIGAPPQRLFPYINSLKRFQEWNPYKDKDPNARNEFSGSEEGPGAVFRWVGNSNVGEGIMKIKDTVQDRNVVIDLEFIRPFAGHNIAEFALAPQKDGTVVTWSMAGRYALVPKIVGLFINMDRMIGGDFELGLSRLKSLVETGSNQPTT